MLNDVCLEVNPVGKPDAVAPHVRFDERGRETGLQCYRARPRLYDRRFECCGSISHQIKPAFTRLSAGILMTTWPFVHK
jgi:hypothetical protein